MKQKPTVRFKIWVEIERIETDKNGNETYHDEDFPIGIAYRDTIEEANKLAENIEGTYGEIPVLTQPITFKNQKEIDDYIKNNPE